MGSIGLNLGVEICHERGLEHHFGASALTSAGLRHAQLRLQPTPPSKHYSQY